ncbi:hypothetical protein D1871_16860 [Nakamurella silvestris]|nr:hypothetical protein D1871_16860 [Nakamurella silvestris]
MRDTVSSTKAWRLVSAAAVLAALIPLSACGCGGVAAAGGTHIRFEDVRQLFQGQLTLTTCLDTLCSTSYSSGQGDISSYRGDDIRDDTTAHTVSFSVAFEHRIVFKGSRTLTATRVGIGSWPCRSDSYVIDLTTAGTSELH